MRPPVLVMACPRSGLEQARLPDGVRLLPVPCSGRLSVPLALRALAGGAAGLLVLGRHEPTCRLRGAEEAARRRADRADRLLELLGLGRGRVRFVEPPAGPKGPMDAVERFAAEMKTLGPAPLGEARGDVLPGPGEGLDQGLGLVRWLSRRAAPGPGVVIEQLRRDGTCEIRPDRAAGRPAGAWRLWAGDLLPLQLLGAEVWGRPGMTGVLAQAEDLLARLRGPGEVLWGPPGQHSFSGEDSGRPMDLEAAEGSGPAGSLSLDRFLLQQASGLPRPGRPATVAFPDGELPRELVTALGHRPLPLGPDPLPGRFVFGAQARVEAEAYLGRAERMGARMLLLGSAGALARWRMVTRDGTWRSSRILPVLGCQLVAPEVAP